MNTCLCFKKLKLNFKWPSFQNNIDFNKIKPYSLLTLLSYLIFTFIEDWCPKVLKLPITHINAASRSDISYIFKMAAKRQNAIISDLGLLGFIHSVNWFKQECTSL